MNASNAVNDTARGRAAFTAFHNEALTYPQNYSLTFDQLIQKLNDDSPDLIRTIGASIPDSHLSSDEIDAGMKDIANQGHGLLPQNYADFMNFIITGTRKSLSFVSAVVGGVEDTAVNASVTAGKIASAAETGITTSLYAMPLLIGGALALFVFLKSKEV